MANKNEKLVDLLIKAPWWISVALGLVAYAALRWGAPELYPDKKILHPFALAASNSAVLALYGFGVISLVSLVFGWKRRYLIDGQLSLDTLKATSWKDFEYLVAEAYRRLGYSVEYSLNKGADGGVDLVLQNEGRTSLVQCKQWRKISVGAPVVREMFGLMTAEGADEVIVVTSGSFTRDARNFAEGKPIQLVDGSMLLDLVRSVQSQRPSELDEAPTEIHVPKCPQCDGDMVERTARRGPHAGQKFWGCSHYPKCGGTRPA